MQFAVHASLSLVLSLTLAACGSGSDSNPGESGFADFDRDGFTKENGDCDDTNAAINPLAPDVCDGIDNNCDGQIDEGFDQDRDNVSICQGDCADNDSSTFPGAVELIDGIDNDCDGIVDNHTASYDDDGDGYSEDQGDCNDNDRFINPGALELTENADGTPEGVDNDCNGEIDEAPAACAGTIGATDAVTFAGAMEVCGQIRGATFGDPTDPRATRILGTFGGTYVPKVGESMVALSTGVVAVPGESNYVDPNSGTTISQDNEVTHPAPDSNPMSGCSMADPSTVNDYAEFRLELQVPTNAQSFSFDFNFMSAEFPEFVCTTFDDTFMVLLESQAFTGNISFDAQGNPVSINVGFFDQCVTEDGMQCVGDETLVGTGYEGGTGGGTNWLTTTSPVVPGEKITLRFIIFDEGDHILDSAVLIDNFRWQLESVDGPITG